MEVDAIGGYDGERRNRLKQSMRRDIVADELDALLVTLEEEACLADEEHQQGTEEVVVVAVSVEQVQSTRATVPSYSFPIAMADGDCLGADSLAARMSALVASYKAHGDYTQIRDEYCGLAIALNREKLHAPAFRPAPKVPFRNDLRSPAHLTLHRDLLVIDCHWLRCREEDVWPRDEEYRALFDTGLPFSFVLASSFASRNWEKLHRADEALILTTWQQCQLMAMKGAVVRDRLTAAENGTGRGVERVPPRITVVKRTMREWCHKDRRITPYRQTYEELWLARELLDKGGSMKDIAVLGGLIAGVSPSSEKTARNKLKRLDNRLAGA